MQGPSRDISLAMPPPLLLLQDIIVTFDVTLLLSGAKLAVAAGDRVCLVGRNGSGKSTLLRIAAGLVNRINRIIGHAGPPSENGPHKPTLAGTCEPGLHGC